MSGNEENWPDIWYWWKVKNGEWRGVGQEFDHVDGTIEEMANDLGAIRLPFSGQYYTVYRLDYRVTKEMIVEYDSIRTLVKLSRDKEENHQCDALWDSFEEKSPAHAWYSTYGHIIYPDTHLVFVVYGNVEGHGILCANFKDMLDVVGQLNLIASIPNSMTDSLVAPRLSQRIVGTSTENAVEHVDSNTNTEFSQTSTEKIISEYEKALVLYPLSPRTRHILKRAIKYPDRYNNGYRATTFSGFVFECASRGEPALLALRNIGPVATKEILDWAYKIVREKGDALSVEARKDPGLANTERVSTGIVAARNGRSVT